LSSRTPAESVGLSPPLIVCRCLLTGEVPEIPVWASAYPLLVPTPHRRQWLFLNRGSRVLTSLYSPTANWNLRTLNTWSSYWSHPYQPPYVWTSLHLAKSSGFMSTSTQGSGSTGLVRYPRFSVTPPPYFAHNFPRSSPFFPELLVHQLLTMRVVLSLWLAHPRNYPVHLMEVQRYPA